MTKRTKNEMHDLTPNEQLVVARLLVGQSYSQIAKEIGHDPSYVSRLAQRPHVVALVKGERGDLLFRDYQKLAKLAPLWLERAAEILSLPVDPAAPNPKLMAVQAQVGKDILDRLGMAQGPQAHPNLGDGKFTLSFDAAAAADALDRLRRNRAGAAPTAAEGEIIDVQGETSEASGGGVAPALTSGSADAGAGQPGVPGGAPAD